MTSAWGNAETRYFFELTPDRILDAVEEAGVRCTGRCLALNSMENRVYDVELEGEDVAVRESRIVKFYRPGRWSEKQILEEHQFLKDLSEAEIPVAPPLEFKDGKTLREVGGLKIGYSLFKKVRGRSPHELSREQLEIVGRLLARLHNVGAARRVKHRIEMTPTTYGLSNLGYLLSTNRIPDNLKDRYRKVVERICNLAEPWFKDIETFRIHGDCHLGNLLWGDQGPFWVDFDDFVKGPAVQDMWLLVPGRDSESLDQRDILIASYEQMREFDRSTLRLVEALRALRFVHFSAWIAKRWEDPAFPKHFPQFGGERYWQEEVSDLYEQQALIEGIG